MADVEDIGNRIDVDVDVVDRLMEVFIEALTGYFSVNER